MPFVDHYGSVQIVLCSDAGKTVPTKDHANESAYDCLFSLLQLSILFCSELSSFSAGTSFLKPFYRSHCLLERNYQTALPRGPPAIS